MVLNRRCNASTVCGALERNSLTRSTAPCCLATATWDWQKLYWTTSKDTFPNKTKQRSAHDKTQRLHTVAQRRAAAVMTSSLAAAKESWRRTIFSNLAFTFCGDDPQCTVLSWVLTKLQRCRMWNLSDTHPEKDRPVNQVRRTTVSLEGSVKNPSYCKCVVSLAETYKYNLQNM